MLFRKSSLQQFGNENFTNQTIYFHMQPPFYTFQQAQNDLIQGKTTNQK